MSSCHHDNISAVVPSGFYQALVDSGKISGISNWTLYLIYIVIDSTVNGYPVLFLYRTDQLFCFHRMWVCTKRPAIELEFTVSRNSRTTGLMY